MAQVQDITSPMTKVERRAIFSIATIYAFRMLGLFMIMPVMSLFAEQLEGSTPLLIGLAISIYGLTQALLQIPFGLLSDKIGRKKMIVTGLLLFAAGSLVAAMSESIHGVLLGRALQGGGAIAAVLMATVADLTQEVHRTKAMAIIGASIGVSFGLAMTFGPLIAGYAGVQGIFWLTAALSGVAIIIILFWVPDPKHSTLHRDAQLVPADFIGVLKSTELLRLDLGIFVLHLILTALFVVIPLLLVDAGLVAEQHWTFYLPVLVSSFAAMIPFIILAEKKRRLKPVFIGAVLVISLANLALYGFYSSLYVLTGALWLFFLGFNLLEATLPSLVSKTAPGDLKGTAMGVYSSSQFLGAFLGGAAGGWVYGAYGADYVFLFCAMAGLIWLLVALTMKPPVYLANLLVPLDGIEQSQADAFIQALLNIKGVAATTLHFEENVAYLKVDNRTLDKNRLQTFLSEWSG